MEMLAVLEGILAWGPSYKSSFTQEKWHGKVVELRKLLERLAEVHEARCRTGDLILQEVYNDLLEELGRKAVILLGCNPDGATSLRNTLILEAKKAAKEVDLLWNTPDNPQDNPQQLEILLEKQIRYLDLARILGPLEE